MTSLNHIIRMNAASCLGFGALFLFASGPVSAFLGTIPPQVLMAIGIGLVVNGMHLGLTSLRTVPRSAEIIWFSAGDLLWWTSSLALVASGFWITTPSGVVSVLVVAMAVAALGVAQLAMLGLSRSGLSAGDHWQRIGRSWLTLPTWVKIWLLALNAAFLAAPIFLSWADSRVILIAYAASGPLLLGLALYEGGMTRLMGIGHLMPWIPLLGWTGYWLTATPETGEPLVYMALLVALITICLVFDIYDLVRWARGERRVMIAPAVNEGPHNPAWPSSLN